MALISAFASAGMLLVTTGVLRAGGADSSALGLRLDRRRLGELAAGFVVTAVLFLAVAAVQSAMVGATWQFTGIPGVLGALADVPLVLCLVLAEELLFRGAALRSLRELAGDRGAIALTAVVFGVYHVLGTQYWAMGAVFQFLMPTIGGLLFAWSAVRSGGLALPIGLHLGGNWVQASVAVFGPRSAPPSRATGCGGFRSARATSRCSPPRTSCRACRCCSLSPSLPRSRGSGSAARALSSCPTPSGRRSSRACRACARRGVRRSAPAWR